MRLNDFFVNKMKGARHNISRGRSATGSRTKPKKAVPQEHKQIVRDFAKSIRKTKSYMLQSIIGPIRTRSFAHKSKASIKFTVLWMRFNKRNELVREINAFAEKIKKKAEESGEFKAVIEVEDKGNYEEEYTIIWKKK